jgi:parallel beta-helix repeat protein
LIDKSISIVGESNEDTVINLYPAFEVTYDLWDAIYNYTDAITIAANNVKLQNLKLEIASPGGYISGTGNNIQIIGNNILTSEKTGVKLNGLNCNITENTIGGFISINETRGTINENIARQIEVSGKENNVKNNVCKAVSLSFSSLNIISDNVVSITPHDNGPDFFMGISFLNSSCNFVCRNSVYGFSTGITLWFSEDNTIVANTINNSASATYVLGIHQTIFFTSTTCMAA